MPNNDEHRDEHAPGVPEAVDQTLYGFLLGSQPMSGSQSPSSSRN
jgi:hypothetical protein